MKKLLVTLAAVLVSASAFGQGTINFTTRIPGTLDAPVFKPDGTTGAGAGTAANAQLFLFSGGAVGAALSPATTFRATPAGAAQNYVIPPATPVTVPGVAARQQVQVVLRAWEGASYDAATVRGQSAPITVTLGGPVAGQPDDFPANLVGLQGFSMQVIPEPSVMALGLLGAAALLYRRRK
jgi:hypothetical protein